MDIMNLLRQTYLVGIQSVHPKYLMPTWLTRQEKSFKVGNRIFPLGDIYIVGFGKAVGAMVPHIVNTFDTPEMNYIKEGIISVPYGYFHSCKLNKDLIATHSKIQFYEGAKHNLPDHASQKTAERILHLVERLQKDNYLFVLISGGGSALFPLPLPPLQLEEKIDIINCLSLAGASITEINTIRKAISATKGGKLIEKAKCKVISLILSDIINSPLEMIASGPTVLNSDPVDAPYQVLQRYNIPMTDNFRCALQKSQSNIPPDFTNVYNILIGDNSTALYAMFEHLKSLKDLNCLPCVLSSYLAGDASNVGRAFASFAFITLKGLSGIEVKDELLSFSETLCIQNSKLLELQLLIKEAAENNNPSLCLIFGGETTVQVKGNGKGGRNQEMVLSASLQIENLSKYSSINGEIMFLSGGTDGIDGPTDVAGAITSYSRTTDNVKLQTAEARKQSLIPEEYLKNNNSYEYFSKLSNGLYLLKPGHTGTNVMDVQILYVRLFTELPSLE